MKLRNKKTGQIIEPYIHTLDGKEFNSLAELNEEWEDYHEEPKDFYYINENGGVLKYIPFDPDGEDKVYMKYQDAIGNYFETKEEAEKAVEKLKAWKRLKDKGFRFTGINDNEESQIMIYECGVLCKANIEHRLSSDPDFILLFGEDEDELRKQKG